MPIETSPYRLSRTQLGYLAAEEYVRSFWYWVIALPIFGVLGLLFTSGIIQAISLMAILWPLSIPARGILTTSRAARLFTQGVRLVAHDDRLEFIGENPGPNGRPLRMLVPIEQVRDVVVRQGVLLVRTYRLAFAPVLPTAFQAPDDKDRFMDGIRAAKGSEPSSEPEA